MASPGKILRGRDWGRQLAALLAEPPAAADAWVERHTRVLKSDSFSRVGLLEVQGQPCYLKLYLAKSPLQKLGFRLGLGRGLRSFAAAAELAGAGIPVPEAHTCLLVPEGMVLLTAALDGGADLRALWLAVPAAAAAQQFMRAAGHIVARLHMAGYAHGDCKWSNLLWDGSELYLVDLEAVRKVRTTPSGDGTVPPRQLRDLARFTIDAEELGASEEQFELFLGSYLATAPCSREQLVPQLRPLLPPIRERHLRQYRTRPRPLL